MLHSPALVDPQLLEETLVDLSLDEARSCVVLRVAVRRHGQRLLQYGLHLGELCTTHLDLSFGISHGPGQPGHLALEQVDRHGPGVVRLHQRGALTSQLFHDSVGSFCLGVRLSVVRRQLGLDTEPDASYGWPPDCPSPPLVDRRRARCALFSGTHNDTRGHADPMRPTAQELEHNAWPTRQ